MAQGPQRGRAGERVSVTIQHCRCPTKPPLSIAGDRPFFPARPSGDREARTGGRESGAWLAGAETAQGECLRRRVWEHQLCVPAERRVKDWRGVSRVRKFEARVDRDHRVAVRLGLRQWPDCHSGRRRRRRRRRRLRGRLLDVECGGGWRLLRQAVQRLHHPVRKVEAAAQLVLHGQAREERQEGLRSTNEQ